MFRDILPMFVAHRLLYYRRQVTITPLWYCFVLNDYGVM